ncbi:hypothetical protein LJK88_44415 [Paenibacillus sp. P26]|nr:hypothetical protein LJK88_44415 [Paenibacillus sp. P26]
MIITVGGTAVNLFFTLTMAYALSRRRLTARGFFTKMVIFTMMFSGGIIPTYLVVKNLGRLTPTGL